MLNVAVVNERGETLVAVLSIDPGAAPDFALVIATYGDEVVLVHNSRRGAWELPGGFVDTGESPDACARREFQEESGQCATGEIGIADILIGMPDGTSQRGRVFRSSLAEWTPFLPNAETDACRAWPARTLPTTLSAIDAWLVRYFLPSRPTA